MPLGSFGPGPMPASRIAMVAVLAAVATMVVVGLYLWTPLGRGGAGVDGPVVHSRFAFAAGGEDAEIAGVVTVDGQCLRIQHPDVPGGGYPAVWPHGTSWQEDPAGVVLPNGDVALVGTWVSGGGGFHSDRSRIESVTDPTGAEMVMTCAQPSWGEVAIFNLGSEVRTLDRPAPGN